MALAVRQHHAGSHLFAPPQVENRKGPWQISTACGASAWTLFLVSNASVAAMSTLYVEPEQSAMKFCAVFDMKWSFSQISADEVKRSASAIS